MDLASKKCQPCHDRGLKAFTSEQAEDYLKHVPGWQIDSDVKKISKEFDFKDFVEAIDFINRVANLAETEAHHPDIHNFYNKVQIDLWTHAVDGLSENDFILASKINLIA